MTSLLYAIGDIHGDLDQLRVIHDRIDKDRANQPGRPYQVVHVGDLVDRRPNSKGVIDFLMTGLDRDEPWIVLKGNHDRLFQWFLEDPNRKDPNLRPDYTWLHPRMGGSDTLRSYGIEVADDYDLEQLHAVALKAVPRSHYDFLKGLDLTFETPDHFFVHAGVAPNRSLANQAEDDLLWIRREFLDYADPLEKLVIHGHTPEDEVTQYRHRLNIDTGAAWGKKLSGIVIDDGQIWVLETDGRAPVHKG